LNGKTVEQADPDELFTGSVGFTDATIHDPDEHLEEYVDKLYQRTIRMSDTIDTVVSYLSAMTMSYLKQLLKLIAAMKCVDGGNVIVSNAQRYARQQLPPQQHVASASAVNNNNNQSSLQQQRRQREED
jgi:hypothetical protein